MTRIALAAAVLLIAGCGIPQAAPRHPAPRPAAVTSPAANPAADTCTVAAGVASAGTRAAQVMQARVTLMILRDGTDPAGTAVLGAHLRTWLRAILHGTPARARAAKAEVASDCLAAGVTLP